MGDFKNTVEDLQDDLTELMNCLYRLRISYGLSPNTMERAMDDYLCDMELLCVKSRTQLEAFRPPRNKEDIPHDGEPSAVSGGIEVTPEGWLHITLDTLLPSCKYRVSNYIGDTIRRLIAYYGHDLPYFEKAFLAIVEYCNYENHNALDNDNKGWKMIPNALKGSVIEDDSQFVLSIGLFSKLSADAHCEIYVMPPEDGAAFMDLLASDMG